MLWWNINSVESEMVDEISGFGDDDVCMVCMMALVGHGLAGLAPR